MTVVDLTSTGFGRPWSHTRSYDNSLAEPTNYGQGTNWMVLAWPRLASAPSVSMAGVAFGPDLSYAFDVGGEQPVTLHGQKVRLTFDPETRQYIYWEPGGSYYCFPEFGGYFRWARLANGEILRADVCSTPNGERISRIERSLNCDDRTYREAFAYSYTNGLLTSVVLERCDEYGQWSDIAKVEYTYHTNPALGTTDSLRTARRQILGDEGWADAGTYYYRYYPALEGGNLKFALEPQAFAGLMANPGISDPDQAADATIAQHACYYFEYDSLDRVIKDRILGGSEEYLFAYTDSLGGEGYNKWKTRTVETLPDGATRVVYANFLHEVLLKDLSKDGSSWVTHRRYDESNGLLVLEASPAAVAGYTYDASGTLSVTLHADLGLIRTYDYTADGYESAEYLQIGGQGPSQRLRSYSYANYLRSGSLSGEPGIFVLTATTVHRSGDGADPLDTSYEYEWYSGTYQISQRTTTLPTVSTEQNGPDTAATRVEKFNQAGNRIESRDEEGHVIQYTYNLSNGLRTRTVEFLAPNQTSGDSLTTDCLGDVHGRVLCVLGPLHEIDGQQVRRATWTVYRDATFQAWIARGYVDSWGNATLVNPVSITKRTIDGRELEAILAVRASSSGPLSINDEFPQSSYVRWTTYAYQNSRLAKTRVYHAIPASGTGAAGTNYAETNYGYDCRGRQNYVKTPGGTITRTVYDARNQQTLVCVGTSDNGATEADPTGNGCFNNNLVAATSYQYDGGVGGGDGNLTQVTQHVDDNTERTMTHQYDGRNRRVATVASDGSAERTTYDHLDQIVRVERYDASEEPVRLACTDFFYDNMGRRYQTSVYAVDPSTGELGNALVGNTWYDKAGRVLKQQRVGSQAFIKFTYDGYGRRTAAYLGYDEDETSWADAGTLEGDTIAEQMETTFDDAGNAILMVARQRMHDATGTGPLTAPDGDQPKARVSYVAMWYDALGRQTATANYGTNGGTPPTRPDSAPARSDDMLVTSFEYNQRGEAFKTVDPAGRDDRQEFDHAGRLVKNIQNYVDGTVDAESPDEDVTTLTTYNVDGQVIALTAVNPATGDQVTRYVYGTTRSESGVARADLLRAEIYPDSDDTASPLGDGSDEVYDRVEYTYNRLSQVLTKRDQNGTIHAYTYDALGRLAADSIATLGTDVDGTVRRIGFGFDSLGRLTTATSYTDPMAGDVVNQLQRGYNAFGRLDTEYQEHGGAVNTSTTRNVGYAYSDGSSNHVRLTAITYPSGWQLGYEYITSTDSALGRPSALVQVDSTYSVVPPGQHLAEYKYLGTRSVVRVDYPWVITTSAYRYDLDHGTPGTYAGLDRFGRIVDLMWRDRDSGTPIERVKYGYDRVGNRIWRENASLPQGADELYAYDGMNQLIDVQRGVLDSGHTSLTSKAFEQQWSLDATGNWSGFKEDTDGDATWDIAQTRAHNGANELVSTTDPTLSLVHDRAGNMTSMPNPQSLIPNPQSLSCTYDAWNRLVKVADGEATVAEYEYDGLFRRVRKWAGNGSNTPTVRDFYYSSRWRVLEEYLGDEGLESVLDQRYAWGIRYVDDLIFREYGEDFGGVLQWRLFAMQDANWNVIAACGWTGVTRERYRYDPYGAPIYLYPDGTVSSNGSAYNWPVLFTGRHLDPDTKLYHYRRRDYHYGLGRFLTRDPIGLRGGDVDLYRYVGNSPLIHVDPTGKVWWNPFTWFCSSGLDTVDKSMAVFPDRNDPGSDPDLAQWNATTTDPSSPYFVQPNYPLAIAATTEVAQDVAGRGLVTAVGVGVAAEFLDPASPNEYPGPGVPDAGPGAMTPAERAAADEFFRGPMRDPPPNVPPFDPYAPRFTPPGDGAIPRNPWPGRPTPPFSPN